MSIVSIEQHSLDGAFELKTGFLTVDGKPGETPWANATNVCNHSPLPIMDHVIKRVNGSKAYGFLDGLFG